MIYESVDQLLADSSTVVVAKVTSQAQEGELPQIFTVSTVTVGETFAPAAIAASDRFTPITPAVGEEIVIRQMGGKDMEAAPAPFLEVGGEYLLFLTPTMLDGKLASQFFVIGVSAGIYQGGSESAKAGEYVSLGQDEDVLPTVIDPGTLK